MPERRVIHAPAYERQDDEGDEAWLAFRTYRDLREARTMETARQKLGRESGYLRQMEEWSSVWSWVRRAHEWDRHQDRLRREASDRAVVEMAERQARDACTIQAGLRPLFEVLAEKGKRTVEDLQEMSGPALMAFIKEVMPAFKSAAELERLARGASTENVHHSGSLVVEDLRSAYMERLRRRQPAQEGPDAPGDEAPDAEPGAVPAAS